MASQQPGNSRPVSLFMSVLLLSLMCKASLMTSLILLLSLFKILTFSHAIGCPSSQACSARADLSFSHFRRLGSRLKEHKDACRKCEKDKSALAEHAWDEGHPIAWEKVRILNSDSRRIRLVIKEALHINESKSTLMNRDTGLELPGCWLATLSHFTHAQ